LNSRTVLRAGYGHFFDTVNVLLSEPNQSGYSRNTSSTLSTTFGQTWNTPAAASPANSRSPLADPFWVRADGTRFDVPLRNALGSMARTGRGYVYTDFNMPHARQQRWQVGIQRQLATSTVLIVDYAGSYSDHLSFQTKRDILPEQYWADGLVRNATIASNMNANLSNPFYIANLNPADFSPVVWADMQTTGFFLSRTGPKNQLLRAFPHMFGLQSVGDYGYYTSTHELQVRVERRFSKGWNLNIGYTGLRVRAADFFLNEFDRAPTERISNDGRPHRLVATSILELPFGRGRRFASHPGKPLDLLIGGWQMAVTYEFQPGLLIDFGNLFYYGKDLSSITDVSRTWDQWFSTANFERSASRGPAAFHRRVFPTRVPDLRADMTNQWNANVAKNLKFSERWTLQLRLDALNLQNRSQMAASVTDPYSTNFGKITSQTSATKRWIQVQARLTF
jgi:hypothetical protein